MPVTGLLALLDDVAAIMDDVAVFTKVAAHKTAGIAGDDLAVNAEMFVGVEPSRELPIVGRVALGSLLNKCVLVPVALVLPGAAIAPLLMAGGLFLCTEGFHKVAHRREAADEAHRERLLAALKGGPEDVRAVEAAKVRQAILTDVVLSAEIVAVSLAAVAEEPLATRAAVLGVVGLGMTAGIYGLVALIVKIDDIGLRLQRGATRGSARHRAGALLVAAMPRVMAALKVVGTVAMFLVGGGILLHGIPGAEEVVRHLGAGLPGGALLPSLGALLLGFAAGAVCAGAVALGRKTVAHLRRT